MGARQTDHGWSGGVGRVGQEVNVVVVKIGLFLMRHHRDERLARRNVLLSFWIIVISLCVHVCL